MVRVCSIHQEYDGDCRICNTDVSELIPNYKQLLAEAEKAGKHECAFCGFTFYLTTDICPKCSTEVSW